MSLANPGIRFKNGLFAAFRELDPKAAQQRRTKTQAAAERSFRFAGDLPLAGPQATSYQPLSYSRE